MVKIDLLDRKIIYHLDLDARQPASAIAKKLKVPKQTISFRINRLTKNNIIKGYYALIDTSLIGMYFTKIFIRLNELNSERRKEILDFVAKQQGISQVLLMEGKYDVQLLFLGKENKEMIQLMDNIYSFCGKEIKEKEIMPIETLYKFNLKTFYKEEKESMIKIKSDRINFKIDPLSWKVLKEISNDARMSVLEIAKNLKISSQLAQYHLKKLIKEKVILGFSISINYEAIERYPYHLTFQMNDHKVIPQFIQFLRQHDKSIFAARKIGNYDCSTEILVKDNNDLRSFVNEIMDLFADKINELDIMLIYYEYKLRLYPI